MGRLRKVGTKAIQSSEILHARDSFAQRWNVDFIDTNYNALKNRILALLARGIIGESSCVMLEEEVFFKLGLQYIPVRNTLNLSRFEFDFKDTELYKAINKLDLSTSDGSTTFLWILESILNANAGAIANRSNLAIQFSEAFALSEFNACLYKEGATYLFYPKGAELLDKRVVNDTLNWLELYPDSREKFRASLKMFQTNKEPRLIIDSLRLSLELFLKQYNSSTASLENQLDKTCKYLKDAQVPKEIRDLYATLISHYAKYNNENVKHNDKCTEGEVEFIIYLTGTFIRFLIKTKEKHEKQNELQQQGDA